MSKHSYAGSTKLPESDMASSRDDNDSDMETEVSSRRSKSMSWSQKTMAQQAKQIKRAMVKQGQMTEEQVLHLTKEEVMALRDAKRLAQSNASCLTEARMEVHEIQKSRNVDPVAEMMDFSAVRFVAANKGPNITAREVEEVNQMCIRDGTCHLCGKGCYNDPSDGHLKSQGHYEKVKEEALCNRLFGKSQTFRRLDSHGCRTKSKRAMREYWGAEVENLGHLARQLVLKESRMIFYKWGKSSGAKTYAITKDSGVKFHLAALRYDRETGKYARKKYPVEDVALWHELDELDGEDCAMPQAPPQDEVLGDGEGNGTGTTADPYANGTWWPVLLCQLPCDDHGPFQGIQPGYIYVVICFYQILDTPLWAWMIEFM